jgi:predicted component of type VI protein secretion system
MITLRLFRTDDPFQEIESRTLMDGEILIGRDSSSDWAIPDQRRDLSRRHCTLGIEGGRIFLRDISTNGVRIGTDRRAAPRGERCELVSGETIHLGEFMILLDADPSQEIGPAPAPAPRPPSHPAPRPTGPITDAALLEAFCCGAGLEPSSFAGEDPLGVMARLGAVYRQSIDDLSAMMHDRATIKDQLQMQRTTISARDNNPLKWAPPAHVAVDLLREPDGGGFLKGAEAFKASFADLRRHGVGLVAGSDAAIHFVLGELDPAALESAARRGSPFASRAEAAWKLYCERHAVMSSSEGDAAIEGAFREGYEHRLASLDAEEWAA